MTTIWSLAGRSFVLFFIFVAVSVEARMKRGRYEFLDSFCNGADIYVSIPWDCSGYVHCQYLGGQNMSFWIECPGNLYYDIDAKTCMWPKNINKPCPPLKDTVELYCKDHPSIRFQSPDHCAQYYDCSDASFSPGLGPYLKECSYPQLFNPSSSMCEHQKVVRCGDRFTPLTKCDYVQHQGEDCTTQDTPGCDRQPDGPNPFPGRLLSEYYLECKNGKTQGIKTCLGGVFDPILANCTVNLDPLSIEVFCASNPNVLLADPSNCARFIDCRASAKHPQLGRHRGECSYPQLYSSQTSRCENFAQVQCGAREEPKTPCQYASNVEGNNIQACQVTKPSCRSLPDGANPFPSSSARSDKYVICRTERTVEIKTCPAGSIFDPSIKGCSENSDVGNTVGQCAGNRKAIIPDPDNCAKYFNCSLTTTMAGFGQYQTECQYPLLFNTQTLMCDDFTAVQCGSRPEPKAPCDYQSTQAQCTGPLCVLPCPERSPSCVGLPDGNNTFPAREMSPFYMTCLGERTVSVGICRFGVYDPTPRTCVTEFDPASIERYCQGKGDLLFPHTTNCARYYNCSDVMMRPLFGKYLNECPYPNLFSIESLSCMPYKDVDCARRKAHKEPCDYMQNHICPVGIPNCAPCEQRLPSCANLPVGNNSFPGREDMYLECQDGRTIAAKKCPGSGKFNATKKTCQESKVLQFDYINPNPFCQANPTSVVASPLSCAQYFSCANKVTLLGNYKLECSYPQLFSVNAGRCVPYNEVNCVERFEPKEPCEYEANLRCPDGQNCIPCRQRYPSCVGLADGNHTVEGANIAYKVCLDSRTIAVRACPDGTTYMHSIKTCSAKFDSKNPALYCSQNPTARLPNPENCALFFDCRIQNTPMGNFLRECPYLQLFSSETNTCQYYLQVKCGTRFEPKKPCDYESKRACTDSVPCEPCEVRNPSCIGLPNGNNSYPGRPNEYIVCQDERTVEKLSCGAATFQSLSRTCALTLDPKNAARYCTANPGSKIENPENCAQYFDCSRPNSPIGPFKHECPYPSLFSIPDMACKDFMQVTCGSRREPKSPCDYAANTCVGKGPECQPCENRFVTCEGRPDGNNTYPGRELTPFYASCFRNRTLTIYSCTTGFFDPLKRVCTTRLEAASIQLLCRLNPGVIRENPLNCAQYFDCSPGSTQAGTFLRECPYPMLFSTEKNVCLNFTQVSCGKRSEPKVPCQYLQNLCNQRDPKCVPCQDRFPSCAGLLDGPNAYPGRESSEEFVRCLQGRTVSVEKCNGGVFDASKRRCGTISNENMAGAFCSANPTEIIPHPTNCAQYYDCREAIAGSYLRECRYPQLFDTTSLTCKNFTDVICGARYEPQAPCEYLQTQCLEGAANCTPCVERLPSCVGLEDGNNAFPGRTNSEYYVKCFRNRTVAVEVCQVSLFDQSIKRCSSDINEAVLSRFCAENPTTLFPDPKSCARYYNCSDPSIKAGLNVRHLSECGYPKLFTYGETECKLFTEIKCESRPEPKAPCEYVENQCFDGPTCTPCEKSYPSCVGKADGSNVFPGREGTEYYIVCYSERTVAVVTCTLGMYDHTSRSCVATSGSPP
ncbi:hypothetical protein CHS0354_034946 [Potamilus streckersoni]|nr:hypothetical protein CHS0354_034946 [Potamilus streckersoni]